VRPEASARDNARNPRAPKRKAGLQARLFEM
jgi:hypothetical protein